MSLIDQALQKAYQQRARLSGNSSLTNERTGEETGPKDRRSSATRELYLHKPQVPIRSHFATANTAQRSTRRPAEPIAPVVRPTAPELLKQVPEYPLTESEDEKEDQTRRIDSASISADSPSAAMPTVAAPGPVSERIQEVLEPNESTLPPFHFHVTTQDTLSLGDAIYFLADEPIVSPPTPLQPQPITMEAPVIAPVVASPLAPPMVSGELQAEPISRESRRELADSRSEVAPEITSDPAPTDTSLVELEPFQVAWEVDEFQLPWACEQAETALATELLAAVRDLPRHDSQVFWVSSLLSGEGRTSIATLLSWLLAKSGHQVLLLQGDWQASSLAQRMGVALETGWNPTQKLATSGLADLCVRSVRENFTILPAVSHASDQRVVSMEPIVELTRQLLPHFPTIVIDAPVGFGHRRIAIPETHETEILVQDVRKTPKQAIAQILDNVPSLRSRAVRIVQNFVPAIGVAVAR